MTERNVIKQITGFAARDGAGVKLVRVLGHDTVTDFDPFLMLDSFDSKEPSDYIEGFPFHPHRGIETVTYLLAGDVKHRDSLGNSGRIVGGSAQWMTAGSGIIHEEMPQKTPWLLGLQLWINLPRAHKMTHPAYRDIQDRDIAKISEDGVSVGVISGEYKHLRGPVRGDYVPTQFLDVALSPGARWELPTDPEKTLFIYVVLGDVFAGPASEKVPAKHAALFDAGNVLKLTGGREGARLVLLSAKPLREPVAWGGPVVMNTEEEVRAAFDEIRAGTFIKHKKPSGV